MNETKQIEGEELRASSGLSSLDDILNGGFMRGHMYLLEGEPGSGKTTLGLQFLLDGVKRGEPVLYFTLSESEEELRFVARSHGWDISGVSLMELNYLEERQRPESQYTVFDSADVELGDTLHKLRSKVDTVRPSRIVIDSLSEFKLLARDPLRFRRELLELKQYFGRQKSTVLLLDDLSFAESDVQIQSLAHGVICLEKLANEFGAERRRLVVGKLRGSRFRGGYHDYKIDTGGLSIYPRLIASEHRAPAATGTLPSGVANLDSLLGGGVSCGTSMLVLGPAGTGKSTIVSTYAISAASRGENVTMFLFDENLGTLLTRCEGLGMPIRERIADKSLNVMQIDPAEMSPGEFVQVIRDSIAIENTRVLVIDSLIGLLNAMPEEKMLLTQLHELLSYLNQVGVTTLMTMVQHGLVGGEASAADLSYLADTLLLLRFFEAHGEVRQALSVLKKRTGNHERTIREIRVAPGGIDVGPPLTEFQGVLTGVPTYVGVKEPLVGTS